MEMKHKTPNKKDCYIEILRKLKGYTGNGYKVALYLLENATLNWARGDLWQVREKRQEMAKKLGMSRVTLSTVLKKMEDDGLIIVGRGFVSLLNLNE